MPSPVAVLAVLEKNARERFRVALDEYRGVRLLDLRVCIPLAAHAADTLTPTKTGVALHVAHIPELRRALAEAEAKARELGWLG